jgi:hypothetical protein
VSLLLALLLIAVLPYVAFALMHLFLYIAVALDANRAADADRCGDVFAVEGVIRVSKFDVKEVRTPMISCIAVILAFGLIYLHRATVTLGAIPADHQSDRRPSWRAYAGPVRTRLSGPCKASGEVR